MSQIKDADLLKITKDYGIVSGRCLQERKVNPQFAFNCSLFWCKEAKRYNKKYIEHHRRKSILVEFYNVSKEEDAKKASRIVAELIKDTCYKSSKLYLSRDTHIGTYYLVPKWSDYLFKFQGVS